jgi:pimeloyl-ACP methyl ester carboxylesterase
MAEQWPGYWSRFPDLIVPTTSARRVTMADGTIMMLYEAGPHTRERIYVIGPIGTPILLLAPLIGRLAADYRVTFWELRGGAFLDEPGPAETADVVGQARDFASFANLFSDDACHIVAWCSGVQIAARGAPLLGRPLDSISLIAPSGLSAADMDLPFMRGIMPLLERIAAAPQSEAERLCDLVRKVQSARPHNGEPDAQTRLQMMNFESSRTTESFARLVTSWCNRTRKELLSLLADLAANVPTQIVHCKDDDVCSYRSSVQLFETSELAEITLHARGGHWLHFRRPDVVGRHVADFIRAHRSEYAGAAG